MKQLDRILSLSRTGNLISIPMPPEPRLNNFREDHLRKYMAAKPTRLLSDKTSRNHNDDEMHKPDVYALVVGQLKRNCSIFKIHTDHNPKDDKPFESTSVKILTISGARFRGLVRIHDLLKHVYTVRLGKAFQVWKQTLHYPIQPPRNVDKLKSTPIFASEKIEMLHAEIGSQKLQLQAIQARTRRDKEHTQNREQMLMSQILTLRQQTEQLMHVYEQAVKEIEQLSDEKIKLREKILTLQMSDPMK